TVVAGVGRSPYYRSRPPWERAAAATTLAVGQRPSPPQREARAEVLQLHARHGSAGTILVTPRARPPRQVRALRPPRPGSGPPFPRVATTAPPDASATPRCSIFTDSCTRRCTPTWTPSTRFRRRLPTTSSSGRATRCTPRVEALAIPFR